MQLSQNTTKVLKNYASINDSIVFEEGKVLRAISDAKTIFSVAIIEEEIPTNACIYNLPSMLAMLSCMNDANLEFKDSNIEISSDNGSFEVFYCSEDQITVPPSKQIEIVPIYEFKLESNELQLLLKASSITNATAVTIRCKDEEVIIKASDRKNETSNSYKKVLGNFDKNFVAHVSVDNLKIIPDDYNVTVATTKSGKSVLLHFKNQSETVQYWIACELDSKV